MTQFIHVPGLRAETLAEGAIVQHLEDQTPQRKLVSLWEVVWGVCLRSMGYKGRLPCAHSSPRPSDLRHCEPSLDLVWFPSL